MTIKIGNAPCSWGVEFADDPRNPSWQSVLDDAKAAGYEGMELGPLGFLPEDPVELSEAMNSRGLQLTAAVMFRPLHDPKAFDEVIDVTHRTCRSLQTLGADLFVLIDSIADGRIATAGRPEEAARMPKEGFDAMMRRLRTVCEIATQEYGMRPALHPHAACYLEFEDELHRAMDSIPPELMGLCIDTGHAVYAKTDPVKVFRQYADRAPYIHFKDINPGVRDKVVAGRIGFYDACAMGLFCNLGDGLVDFSAVKAVLEETGYSGWGTVEQDCDPSANNPVIDDARANFDFLRKAGIASEGESGNG